VGLISLRALAHSSWNFLQVEYEALIWDSRAAQSFSSCTQQCQLTHGGQAVRQGVSGTLYITLAESCLC